MSKQVTEERRTAMHVDVEEIESTRSEKLLAVVLAAFLLIGGLWLYFNLDDIPSAPNAQLLRGGLGSEADRAAIAEYERAQAQLQRARFEKQRTRSSLELRREAYRTALDAGKPAGELEQSYRRAQDAYENAALRTREKAAEVARLRAPAGAAETRVAAESRRAQKEFDDQRREHDRNTFLLRLLYVLAATGGGYWLLKRVRGRRPRYLALALAFVGFAAVQAIVMAIDYSSDYVDYRDAGLLTISLAGIAMTLVAFVALQRYLARRVPERRVRKRQCPFCGYPVGDNDRCEGCGREVYSACSACSSRRRVGPLTAASAARPEGMEVVPVPARQALESKGELGFGRCWRSDRALTSAVSTS
jgi:hypothetical protein